MKNFSYEMRKISPKKPLFPPPTKSETGEKGAKKPNFSIGRGIFEPKMQKGTWQNGGYIQIYIMQSLFRRGDTQKWVEKGR